MLPTLLIALFSLNPTKEVSVRFISPQYTFQSGRATLFSSTIFKEKGNNLTLANGETLNLARANVSVLPLKIRKDGTSVVEFSRPGEFTAILSEVEVTRIKDGKHFLLPLLTLQDVRITRSDLEKGEAEILIPPLPVFRVRVIDREGNPVPEKEVSFQPRAAPVQLIQIKTDQVGEIFMLGNPHDYRIELLPKQGESLKLEELMQ